MTDDHSVDELRCVEVVELLTAYLDGALADETRKQVDEHLRDCEGCRAALAQWQTVAELAGRLTTVMSPVSTRTSEPPHDDGPLTSTALDQPDRDVVWRGVIENTEKALHNVQ